MNSTKEDMGNFNLKKLNNVEVIEQYVVKISNRFAVLENLDDDDYDYVDISRACENIRENIEASATVSVGYYELKQHKL
jgi:hypothetical protein